MTGVLWLHQAITWISILIFGIAVVISAGWPRRRGKALFVSFVALSLGVFLIWQILDLLMLTDMIEWSSPVTAAVRILALLAGLTSHAFLLSYIISVRVAGSIDQGHTASAGDAHPPDPMTIGTRQKTDHGQTERAEGKAKERNPYALASMILGIAAWLLFGVIRPLAVLAMIAGLILGIIGVRTRRMRWMAIVGILLCGLALFGVLSLLFMILTEA